MNIRRSELAAMIREAVLRRVLELREAPQGADPDAVEKGDQEREIEREAEPRENPPQRDDAERPPEVGQDPESAKRADRDHADAIDADGTAGKQTGQVNRDIAGKTIQSITLGDDESTVLPGAKEVLISFDQGADPLRILVTPTGRVSFFWRGTMQDVP